MPVASVDKVTSADVARLAGVSRATVSYVLNDKPGQTISESTRATVLKAAEKLGYRPNTAARRLAGGSARHVLLLAPRVPTADQLSKLSWLLTDLLAEHGIALSIAFDSGDAASLVRSARATGVDAILAMRPFEPGEQAALEAVGVSILSSTAAAMSGQEVLAAAQVEHLAARGHTRLAFARPAEEGLEFFVSGREAGARAAADAHGAEIVDSVAFEMDGSDAATIMTTWKAAGVTAVVAYNDEVGMRVLHGIRMAGLSCPDDFAVIGVDNLPVSQVSDPPLSSIEILADRYAEAIAAEVVGDAPVASASVDPGDVLRVVVRASS
ncbi:LacI family DNA-binding transcriptional regulator [Microbacterium sp. B2969]|uniref:LacI family DNA-binding transcriptional regulator n=1 Tax=Microbacterium alkaliflavum TaxID=3248839 RepID=A0ABW7Q3X2_9MICO